MKPIAIDFTIFGVSVSLWVRRVQPPKPNPYTGLEPDPVYGYYASLEDMHNKNAIRRVPHIKGLGPDDCPGCLWVKNRVANSAQKSPAP
jgi:hypothetical protein